MTGNPFAALIEPAHYVPIIDASAVIKRRMSAPKNVAKRIYGNPWNLTPRECSAMSMLIENGNNKAAGQKMGVKPKTVEHMVNAARRKMKVGGRIQAAVAYDRWVRSQA